MGDDGLATTAEQTGNIQACRTEAGMAVNEKGGWNPEKKLKL